MPNPGPSHTALIYSPRYTAFDYGPDHPLRNLRLQLTYSLITSSGLLPLPHARLLESPEPSRDDLLLWVDPGYLRVLEEADSGALPPEGVRYGLGTSDCPVFPGVARWSALVCGGSLLAMDLVDRGEVATAFHFAGGLHHAGAAHASGFCYLNDAALLIAHLVKRGRRVAYVDIDAHHGDGVQNAFYDTDQVLTISLHETGRYLFPGTGSVEELGEGKGKGYAVNVPLPPVADDEIFLWAFSEVVPPLLKAFRPDILVTQLGIDTYRSDPLTHLQLTLNGFSTAVRWFWELSLPWVALGGGGYDLTAVPRAWASAWALMNGATPPEELPESFRQEAFRQGIDFRGMAFFDDSFLLEGREKEAAWGYAKTQVAKVKEQVFPLYGLV